MLFRKRWHRDLTSVILLSLATYSMAWHSGVVWGKRVWKHELDDHRQIVVDERGNGENLQGLKYCWRLISADGSNGQTLFSCSGVNRYSGTGTLIDRISVLQADLIEGELVTVFNQRGQCWAYVVHLTADGSASSRPDVNVMGSKSDLGDASKSAGIEKHPDGQFELLIANQDGESRRYELHKERGEAERYHWLAIK